MADAVGQAGECQVRSGMVVKASNGDQVTGEGSNTNGNGKVVLHNLPRHY